VIVVRIVDGAVFDTNSTRVLLVARFGADGRGLGQWRGLAVVPLNGDPAAVAAEHRARDGYGAKLELLQSIDADRRKQRAEEERARERSSGKQLELFGRKERCEVTEDELAVLRVYAKGKGWPAGPMPTEVFAAVRDALVASGHLRLRGKRLVCTPKAAEVLRLGVCVGCGKRDDGTHVHVLDEPLLTEDAKEWRWSFLCVECCVGRRLTSRSSTAERDGFRGQSAPRRRGARRPRGRSRSASRSRRDARS
jgi:hypothetical protein